MGLGCSKSVKTRKWIAAKLRKIRKTRRQGKHKADVEFDLIENEDLDDDFLENFSPHFISDQYTIEDNDGGRRRVSETEKFDNFVSVNIN